MSKIRSRTPVMSAESDRILFYAHREHALRLLQEGTVRIDGESMRIAGSAKTSLRAGSFGVHREHVPVNQQYGLSGGVVFSHKQTYEGLAA